MVKSIEPKVADWGSNQIQDLGWPRNAPEQLSVDAQVDASLHNSPSKQGGAGGGRPDHTIMMSNGAKTIPVFIEYKGTKGKLVSLNKKDLVILDDDKGVFQFTKAISKYAVNGAAYYAYNVVNDTDYKEVLAVGVNGYEEADGKTKYEVQAYLVTSAHPDLPYFMGEYSDLSFLSKKNMSSLFQEVLDVQMDPEELHRKALLDDAQLDRILKDLNQHLRDENRIRVSQRINIVATCIMAALGVQNEDGEYVVAPLEPSELMGTEEPGNTDGDKVLRKSENFLKAKNIPTNKQKTIINSLRQTLVYSNLQVKDAKTGISPIRSAYQEVFEKIIPAFKRAGTIDFTGKLFNVMNDWVDVPDGDTNDVVLTPRYITSLMARLTRVDMNSYVWDWALGSGGFLISSMNLMLDDARKRLNSPDELLKKQIQIKTSQLLGIEKLPDIYILAVLNMILMGDGSSNIINEDSLTEFDGTYAYGKSADTVFPADVFLLNPPYSADGNGMIFVMRALERMKGGYAAVIIQDSAGSGRAVEYTTEILKNNRLLFSIKMPSDLFKASVQTSIYVFEVGKAHQEDDIVKFIDFRDDGYKRSNRKKASSNLQDTGTAKERYEELVQITKNGANNSQYYIEGKEYFEDTINPKAGNDWNFEQHQVKDLTPSEDDYENSVAEYMAWEISQVLMRGSDD